MTLSQHSIALMGLHEPKFTVNFPKSRQKSAEFHNGKVFFCTTILKTICLNSVLLFSELVLALCFEMRAKRKWILIFGPPCIFDLISAN